jgi:hypothetical protein
VNGSRCDAERLKIEPFHYNFNTEISDKSVGILLNQRRFSTNIPPPCASGFFCYDEAINMMRSSTGVFMKNLLILLLAMFLPACISTPEVKNREVAPAQSYRFEGDDAPTKITGVLEKYGNDWAYHGAFLTVQIGNEKVIVRRPVDRYDFSGVIGGGTYRDKKVNASCIGYPVTDRWTDVRCTVFVDDQQTVTLTF